MDYGLGTMDHGLWTMYLPPPARAKRAETKPGPAWPLPPPPPTTLVPVPPSLGETGGNQTGSGLGPVHPPTHHPGSPSSQNQAGQAQAILTCMASYAYRA